MIKVAIDVSPLFNQSRFRGVGMYVSKLLELLKKRADLKVFEFKNDQIPKEADLVHYPYFFPFSLNLPFYLSKRFVVTVHDLIPLVFPEAYPPGFKGKVKFMIEKNKLKKASRIITDSESSKNDIVKYIDYPENQIDVVYLSAANEVERVVDKKILLEIKKKYNLPEKFVLYVGDVNYNKNLEGLLKACRASSIKLVIVGKQAVQSDFDENHIENYPLVKLNEEIGEGKDVHKLGFIEKEDLAGLYSLATMYCQPSFYEGFGLQILEAMRCGCPVITSNVSSMPEVAGKAAILVDPHNITSISQAINSLIDDKNFKEQLIEDGYQQAKKFSWDKAVDLTINSYEKVLEK